MIFENNEENGKQLPVICNNGKMRTFFHENSCFPDKPSTTPATAQYTIKCKTCLHIQSVRENTYYILSPKFF